MEFSHSEPQDPFKTTLSHIKTELRIFVMHFEKFAKFCCLNKNIHVRLIQTKRGNITKRLSNSCHFERMDRSSYNENWAYLGVLVLLDVKNCKNSTRPLKLFQNNALTDDQLLSQRGNFKFNSILMDNQ